MHSLINVVRVAPRFVVFGAKYHFPFALKTHIKQKIYKCLYRCVCFFFINKRAKYVMLNMLKIMLNISFSEAVIKLLRIQISAFIDMADKCTYGLSLYV